MMPMTALLLIKNRAELDWYVELRYLVDAWRATRDAERKRTRSIGGSGDGIELAFSNTCSSKESDRVAR